MHNLKHMEKCIEKYEYEIDELLKKEAMNNSYEVDYSIQKELSLHLGNRERLKKYMKDKYEHIAYNEHGEHRDVIQTDKHKSSYFGG